jgi:ribosome-binding factor A
LKREIGEAIRRELPVEKAGLVTVNDVEVAGDLKQATVFVSILGNPEQQKTGLLLLQKNRARLQGLLAKAVILKYTPVLRFMVDDSVARGNRVLQIIEELEKDSVPTDQ